MSNEIHIVTNGHPRNVLDAFEVTARERQELDYLDWRALDAGEDSASFFRYQGVLYDLSEFEAVNPDHQPGLAGWHGIQTDSYFSAVLIRWTDEQCDTLVVGRASW